MGTGAPSILGRYQILTELGRGAMGVVYKAYDPTINRFVAIKTISLAAPDAAEGREYRARFLREAEAAGRLSHLGIVAIFDIGEDARTSSPFIVMEYVAGRSLEEIIPSDGSLPLHTSLKVIQEVAEALAYAHSQGVVHRDVKPSNIMIAEDGHAKIADFGIAQLNVMDSARPDGTWGTPAYMSPEQIRGDAVDGRSDLFSLGIVLYTLLTGHRPFQGNSNHTISLGIVNREPVPASALNVDLAPELDGVIARAMAKSPAERYQTGTEMALDLQRLRDGIDSEGRVDTVLPQSGDGSDRAAESRDFTYDHLLRKASKSFPGPRSLAQSVAQANKTAPSFQFTRPWQQLGVASLALGFLAVAFAGLWWAIPSAQAADLAEIAFHTAPTVSMATVISLQQSAANSPEAQDDKLPAKNSARRVGVTEIRPDVSEDSSHSCQLGIAVEHHFVTADISVWIDDKASYSHSLRGAIKKRVVLFKGVDGYLSDVVHLKPGDHQIRVRVLSADGSYDESGSISGTFAPGSEKLLAVDFDKHNRRMHLMFQAEKHF